jgi:FtsH-binding integral membrane protein
MSRYAPMIDDQRSARQRKLGSKPVVGMILFVGQTAYDTQRIKAMYLESDVEELAGKKAVLGTMALYLDFINLFMMLLQLLERRQN